MTIFIHVSSSYELQIPDIVMCKIKLGKSVCLTIEVLIKLTQPHGQQTVH